MGETKNNIFQTIAAVMEDVGVVGKDSLNEQQKFKYRGIDAVMNALNPAFIKHHLFVVPEVMDQTREERRTAKGGMLLYSVCRMKYTFYAEDGSHIEAVVVGEGQRRQSNQQSDVGCVQICLLPGVLHPDRRNERSGCGDAAGFRESPGAGKRSDEECIPERVRQNRKEPEMYFESNRRRFVGTPDGGTIPERDEEF